MLPTVFVSHGSPGLAFEDVPARAFFHGLGRTLPRPSAILCISAHWGTEAPMLTGAARLETIHDYYGFPKELYALRYPAPGAPALAERVRRLLGDAGIGADIDPARGLDHGAWSPLILAYPDADIPVVQLSLQAHRDARQHHAMGRALAPLRQDGVLVLGSGAVTHNLAEFGRHRLDAPPIGYARAFDAWLARVLEANDEAGLLDWESAPHARHNHPSPEHFLPLFVARAAAGADARATRLHASWTHGFLSMAAYAFA
jgi:4,5-DOPA dioxygenase extradiol